MEPTMQQMAQGGQVPPEQMPPEQMPPEPQQKQMKADGDESQDMQEVERGLQAITEALYKNDETSQAFANAISAEDPVGSLTKATMQLITEIDNKINLGERAMAPLAVIACGELMELAEASSGVVLDEAQQQQAVMATWEGILGAYGVGGEDAVNFAGSTSEQEQNDAVATYEGVMK